MTVCSSLTSRSTALLVVRLMVPPGPAREVHVTVQFVVAVTVKRSPGFRLEVDVYW